MSQAQPQQQKPQPQKQKKLRMRSALYEVSGSTVKLKNKKCARCGSLMAHHAKPVERWVCGSCGLTDFGPK